MRTSSVTILTAALLLILTFHARSQVIEDALRLSGPADIISARTAAMGNAFVGLADDVTALYWNPAGLAQLRYSEFAVGLTNFTVTTDATLLGNTGSDKQSVLKFNDIGLAIPFPVVRGALVFGAAYNRLSDYTGGMNTSAYNHLSSIQRSLYNAENEDVDLAWQLGLGDR